MTVGLSSVKAKTSTPSAINACVASLAFGGLNQSCSQRTLLHQHARGEVMHDGPPVIAYRPDADKSHLELIRGVSGWNERQQHRNHNNRRKPPADLPPHRGMHLRPGERRARVLGYSSPR